MLFVCGECENEWDYDDLLDPDDADWAEDEVIFNGQKHCPTCYYPNFWVVEN